MKRTFIPALLMVSFLLMAATAPSFHPVQKAKNDLSGEKIVGAVKSITANTYTVAGKSGKEKPGSLIKKATITYNNTGNKTEETDIDYRLIKNGYTEKHSFKYNGQGYRLEENVNVLKDGETFTNNFIYDDKGNKIEENSHGSDSAYHVKMTWKYNSDGQITERTFTDLKMGNNTEKYKYDAKGNRAEVARFDAKGNLVQKDVLSYDDKGNEIEDQRYDAQGKATGTAKYKYKYDKTGNWVESTYFVNNQAQSITKREIEYF